MSNPAPSTPDIREHGKDSSGAAISLDRRLFFELFVFDEVLDIALAVHALESRRIPAVLYVDLHNPQGIGLMAFHEDPVYFATELRDFLVETSFSTFTLLKNETLFGRTYSLGHERDLEDWLLKKPRRTIMNRDWPWAVWYPLRRKGSFASLERVRQREILQEHGKLGHAFGNADHGHDIRLACHGLDKQDNDFVIGIVSKDLHPISALVEAMRRTTQTSEYLDSIGPFFVGRKVWQDESVASISKG